MEEGYTSKPVKEEAVVAPSNGEVVLQHGSTAAKRQRFDRCLPSFMEVSIEPGIKSLKHLDSKKFKSEIKRWAKAVVTYARQVSDRFGSSRRNRDSDSGKRFGSYRDSSKGVDSDSGERFGSSCDSGKWDGSSRL